MNLKKKYPFSKLSYNYTAKELYNNYRKIMKLRWISSNWPIIKNDHSLSLSLFFCEILN